MSTTRIAPHQPKRKPVRQDGGLLAIVAVIIALVIAALIGRELHSMFADINAQLTAVTSSTTGWIGGLL